MTSENTELTDEQLFECLKSVDPQAKRLPIGLKLFAQALQRKMLGGSPGVNAASAEDMKVYDSIAAGYHRSTAGAIEPSRMRGPCGMATSQHEGRRRITLEFDMPEDAVEAHSALSDMGWSHRSIRQDCPSLGPGQALDPEIVNKIADQAGFGPAAARPEFSGLMQLFFNIAFKMGVQSATSAPGRT